MAKILIFGHFLANKCNLRVPKDNPIWPSRPGFCRALSGLQNPYLGFEVTQYLTPFKFKKRLFLTPPKS